MKTVLFTDTHFGVKQNSITWLNSQLDFIYKQFIPYIESMEDDVRVVHLGDVFDSRSSISTLVASRVRDAFRDIRRACKEFIIVGGNHDYYSPNSDKIDTISLILNNLDIILVTQDILKIGDDVFIPWYKSEELGLKGMIKKYLDEKYNIYTHTDLVTDGPMWKGPRVFSGHIHIPCITHPNSYNLGSCYALNFSDSNSERGFYVIDNENVTFVPNKESIRYWRFMNEDIFGDWDEVGMNDYIEMYIRQENLSKSEYINKLDYIVSKYKNSTIVPHVTKSEMGMDMERFKGCDISTIVMDLMPEELMDKFKVVQSRFLEY